MTQVDNTKRYDCFISFHGSETLSSLGFTFPSKYGTVRNFVEVLSRCLKVHDSRSPSIFLDSDELAERVDNIFDAILQLRGGGLALVLLTKEYFQSKYCMAELRSFLQLANLKNDPIRHTEAIGLRVLSLEGSTESARGVDRVLAEIKEINRRSSPDSFLHGLEGFVVHDVKHRAIPEYTAQEIAGHVWQYWDGDSSCLGEDVVESFVDMQRFFVARDKNRLGTGLRTAYMDCTDVLDVIEKARSEDRISYSNVDKLIQACRRCQNSGSAQEAVSAYKRKWCSSHWSWSMDTKDALQSNLDEAKTLVAYHTSSETLPQHSSHHHLPSNTAGPPLGTTAGAQAARDPNEIYDDAYRFEKTGHFAKAAELYEVAIDQGNHVWAMYNLAYMLQTGRSGVQKDIPRAVHLYERAISEGAITYAMYNLGYILEHGGPGVAMNKARAATLYRRAVDEGKNIDAMYNLGCLYRDGLGVDKDVGEAAVLYAAAVLEANHQEARKVLGEMLSTREGGAYVVARLSMKYDAAQLVKIFKV